MKAQTLTDHHRTNLITKQRGQRGYKYRCGPCDVGCFGKDRFYFNNRETGARHSLAVDCTDAARLNAHWQGFVSNSTA